MALGSEGSDSSLHFPRILCLHGGGTNARIFRMQCRAFKYHLGSEFRFVFAEAPFPARPGPDVTAVYSNCGPFRGWLRPVDETEDQDFYAAEASMLIQNSINTATIADNHLGATGEVVGVLGFSQGARIAASLLYNQQLRCQQLDGGSEMKTNSVMNWPNFRFAVLLAGLVPPLQPSAIPPLLQDDAPGWEGLHLHDKLQLPTVHVHGLKDVGLEFHRHLAKRYCIPGSYTIIEWQGEHRVPIKTKDVFPVAEQMLRLAQ
ncbi:serine hydrolase (FSH1) domain-containing protein [Hirsutella rhossiliensis]|uniref:Serine hydrolase (FSH1) domain-containing protein n=1 Tax=Hirsutella rhossiliensis TaxID=111463 RepID=A0A9P8SFR0_9HYPO|nr:serine hydrolase (FSH1) domain-containing protein [Hirsutella rhossiliensis]KAH0959271.1 serine hydrolase (FSH1) domain-containing protein [Hirsutella rhossiliensis]